MALFGLLTRSEAKAAITDAVAAAKKKAGIIDSLTVEQLDRAKADVQKWRDALEYWEDTQNPDRYEMMQLYQEIEQDDSVATHINTIGRAISGSDFEIGKVNGEEFTADVEKTAIFKAEWFEKLVRLIIEAEMMGFTLVEVKTPEINKYTTDNFVLIPRELVIPEWGKVRTRQESNTSLIDYKDPMYAQRLLQIGDKTTKGLYNNLALLYIYKKNALAFWANFQSKFGIPPVIVKTDLSDKTKTDSLTSFLQDMRSNTFAMVGLDDEVEVLNITNQDAYNTFKELIKMCDDSIAKVLEGQTMTSSDGSSRSQAEVHEHTGEDWHIARLRRVEWVINTQLMAIINNDLSGFEGFTFRFKEIKDIDGIIDRVVKLRDAGYQVDVKYLENLTGLPLEAVQASPSAPPASVIKAIDALYDGLGCDC